MSIPSAFDNQADFVRTIARTHDGLMPLLRWLDELHDGDKPKATAAAFVLLGQRLLQSCPCGEETAMREMAALYHTIVDGGLDTVLRQDNGRL